MTETQMRTTEHEIVAARRDVQQDIEALGSALRGDQRLLKNRLRANAPAVVGGAAALGLIIGFGGKKAIKLLLGAGVVATGLAIYAKTKR